MWDHGTKVATAPGTMVRSGISFLMLLGALVVACGTTNAKEDKLCTPGANVFCRCVDRTEGTKKCKDDAQSFDECLPCDGSGESGEGSGGEDGLGAGHGTDMATETKEHEVEPTDPAADDTTDPDTDATDAGTTTPPSGTTKDGGSGTSAKDGGSSNGSSTGSGSNSNSGSSKGSKTAAASYPDAAHCKTLKNVAPRIEAQKLADVPTDPKGGKIADGLYVQSWAIEFTGDDGDTGPTKHFSQETLEIKGEVGRYVFEDDEGKKASGGFRLSIDDDSKKANVAYECPAAAPKDLAYDATDRTLIIYDPPYARVFYLQKEGK